MSVYKLEGTRCDIPNCTDCAPGECLWEMFVWTGEDWKWVATSMQSYKTEAEARMHWWGFQTQPGDCWVDGRPMDWDKQVPGNAQRFDQETANGGQDDVTPEISQCAVALVTQRFDDEK